MSDKSLIVELPEALLEQVKSAQVDVRQTIIEALERKVQEIHIDTVKRMPTQAEIDEVIQNSIARNASGKFPLRQIGNLKGQIWMSDDFDDELLDEFWFGGDT